MNRKYLEWTSFTAKAPLALLTAEARLTGDSSERPYTALVSSIARNPASQNQITTPALLGFALAEATGLFGLIIAFMILFVF